ncbi:PH domain-containing protein [Oceanihabitans sediminis]|uniref:Uncharacterized protein YyaB-like PH domain-containing protein n=1 Tax=Oceanihabitans sediminis TaxID=1812012 RepID=A0A368P1Z9_9FLAO|nr:PH domain-containing protein [Oceanihabitans sediminis]MDX1277871.1 PH domain-containing protein [Oceanihabitans sediminis]MDX1774486.1 PH domain-containing protein [Oceanihabitans sediminis]RBP27772.1 PH (Pleckstrin Homology) domain-containing protein [Oceanihabitans sediminis]RCU56558.1 hypothetical protein DU428_11720 [Oceanihabitans sediminis]
MPIKHSSKISYGLLLFVFLVFFTPVFYSILNGAFNTDKIGGVVLLVLLFAFVLHVFLKTEYTINNKELEIKCGFFSYKPIHISEIREINKTNNIISSPAASFDRIEVKHGKYDSIILSPKDKLQFSKDLREINPNIKINLTISQ